MVDKTHKKMSVRRQCEVLELSRSGYYYEPGKETAYNLMLMKLMDEEYTRKPYYGGPRLTAHLNKMGYNVNIKRVKRLMKVMGIEAIYQKPKLSQKKAGSYIYPYLLKGLTIDRSNLVWCADITYIRLSGGFMYLVAIMDWYSRYVLSWELSNTLEASFCVEALKKALSKYTPVYSNTDQGSQFTGSDYIHTLKTAGIQISMDGKGRCIDNIMIERLWRSLKYEDIYINDYTNVIDLRHGLTHYFDVYNHDRLHQALDYQTPYHVFLNGMAIGGDTMLN